MMKSARSLESKLWGGFSTEALQDLARLESSGESSQRAAQAACLIARWFAIQGDYEAALEHIVKMRELDPKIARARRQHLLEASFLCRLGRAVEARTVIQNATRGKPFDPSAALGLANTWNRALFGDQGDANDEQVLHQINRVFAHFEMAGLRKTDSAKPLTIDNIEADSDRFDDSSSDQKITVIVPAYNASDTIATSLSSLARQSWRNIEVLVVDDASTDDTVDVVDSFCRSDRRFRLLRQTTNGGGYVCRNRALAEATGDYVTVQDADDWSHPARLAMHMADLRSRGREINISDWAPATDDLCFWGGWASHARLLTTNTSSLLFRKSMVDISGPWDHVRIAGDGEFLTRTERIHGLEATKPFLRDCPLAIGRSRDSSLARTPDTHAATQNHGLRREYREAGRAWLADVDLESVRQSGWSAEPPFFPAPASIRPQPMPRRPLDVLFVGDWNLTGGTAHSAMNMIQAARAAAMDCGVFHYRRYDLDVSQPLSHHMRAFFRDNDLDVIAAGERVRAKNVVITYPLIASYLMDRFPEIDHDNLFVVVNQMAERDTRHSDVAYDPLRIRANLKTLLGSEGRWAPISDYVRDLMKADPRYPAPTKATWTPLIDVDRWCTEEPRRRGRAGKMPLLGRHGRDHYLKWPSSAAALKEAYCADRRCVTRFLGGAQFARERLDGFPTNWREEAYGARDVRAFLSQLDFFLHFPHENYIEEFGRAVMEAMAMGVPAILPPVFRQTFGNAATYASGKDSWSAVQDLWQDPDAWTDKAVAGQAFVIANCSFERFASRLTDEG